MKMPLKDVTPADKYTVESGLVYLTGTQALVRLPMMQRRLDLARGLNTAGFISGYRGSPLAGLDNELWRAVEFLKRHHIQFQPGVNEDLAATAVWGSQQVNLYPGARYDGVFAMWYGKGPGWTARAMSSSTQMPQVHPAAAVCCCSPETTMTPSSRACRTRANTHSSTR